MSIYKRGKMWWIDAYVGASRRRIRVSSGTSDETQARIVEQTIVAVNRGVATRQAAHAIIDSIRPDGAQGLEVAGMMKFYEMAAKEDKLNISSHEMTLRANMIGALAMWLKDNSKIRYVSEIDESVAWKFSTFLGETGITTKTRNNKIGLLHVSWKVFLRRGVTSVNPWGVARVARDRREEQSGRAYTEDEVERILAAAREVGCEWEGVVTVALYTGLRKRDCELIRWRGNPEEGLIADLERRMIYGTPSKTSRKGIRVAIPMHEKVFRVMNDAGRDGEYVFPFRARHDPHARTKKDDVAFCEILKAAGVEAGEGEMLTFHSLRHTFVSKLAEAGVDTAVRMKLAGHTDIDTHMIYTHDAESSRAAIEALA